MRIAIVTETSTVQKSADIVAALNDRGHDVLNVGMRTPDDRPELTYIHTGLLSALLLNAGRVDFVVGGCGTGQGFQASVDQYPNVVCGHLQTPLDAWLFARINAGNCVSLALNQGYGWGSNVNLRLLFDQLFAGVAAEGYPPHRRESQDESRRLLSELSRATHRTMADIVRSLDDRIVQPVLTFPGVWTLLDPETLADPTLGEALADRRPVGVA